MRRAVGKVLQLAGVVVPLCHHEHCKHDRAGQNQ
ncbi:hypothetical protein KYG_04749 [Acidovorax sp. NO-1]|nr:hypothetical protein KYG_04749 [Acidovorax sp. NO-1]